MSLSVIDHILIVSVYFLKNAYKISLLLSGRYQAVQWGELLVIFDGIFISAILSLILYLQYCRSYLYYHQSYHHYWC